mgnify:CR=1 FL=1
MIVNTGQRTDIPAFYSTWFMNRIKAGFVMVRNPFNPHRVTRYSLRPDAVDAICFCTKNPKPMIPRLKELHDFRQVWHVTITAYGEEIEPHAPPISEVVDSFRRLSDISRIGSCLLALRPDFSFFDLYFAETSGYLWQDCGSFARVYEWVHFQFYRPVQQNAAQPGPKAPSTFPSEPYSSAISLSFSLSIIPIFFPFLRMIFFSSSRWSLRDRVSGVVPR